MPRLRKHGYYDTAVCAGCNPAWIVLRGLQSCQDEASYDLKQLDNKNQQKSVALSIRFAFIRQMKAKCDACKFKPPEKNWLNFAI